MADRSVSRPPRDAKSLSDAEVEKWAAGGGSEPRQNSDDPNTLKMTSLRLPQYLLDQIDTSRSKRTGRVSRNNWIWEAIEDKLEREEVE